MRVTTHKYTTMATLLRKVWESVSSRSASASASMNPYSSWSSSDGFHQLACMRSSSMGDFDRIPIDIIIVIVKLLGPKEAAKLTAVCKSWKFIVSDNRLWIYFLQNQQDPWDSIFFAETHLRSGSSLWTFANPMTDLSFMHIYGQRAKVPGTMIVDGGSGYCKYGWSKYSRPSGRSATFLEFGNIESPMYSRLRHFFSTIYSRMQVKTSTQPIIVSIPICHYDDAESDKSARKQLEEAILSALFDMNVPAVCAMNQAVLALFAARRTSGIVVNIGFHQTSVVPIIHGKVMHNVGVETIGVGALKLTSFLKEQMQQKNIYFGSLYTVRTLKENLCYVAPDYEAELSKDTKASFQVPSEGFFTLDKERFQTGEILFQPRIAGMRAMGLHNAVALCMEHCQEAEQITDDSWYKTIVLAGGSACLPGLAERLEKEVRDLLPPSMSFGVRVLPPPCGVDSAWHGAKLISNLSTFPTSWCVTRKQFRQRSKLIW
ncbi:PREDICTED: actin-related protein 8 [Ipomoea nil]|uniref:actin-related protein 8 n=1 Tax=Ipomoea nil TaxID=35883 RepID=UPI0009013775|nr:PREDICTED: actin-related protein 8 [Ipomoea nil]